MHAATRTMLDQIDRFFVQQPREAAEELWQVLSALRGPDADPTYELKGVTTEPIRRAAFPRMAEAMVLNAVSVGYAGTRYDAYRLTEGYHMNESIHFASHAQMAARVLGLTT